MQRKHFTQMILWLYGLIIPQLWCYGNEFNVKKADESRHNLYCVENTWNMQC